MTRRIKAKLVVTVDEALKDFKALGTAERPEVAVIDPVSLAIYFRPALSVVVAVMEPVNLLKVLK